MSTKQIIDTHVIIYIDLTQTYSIYFSSILKSLSIFSKK
jgi:hypothetical protein